MIITIDGPSAAGKSTLAKNFARKLGFIHLDSGAIYRSLALYIHEIGCIDKIENGDFSCLEDFHYTFSGSLEEKRHFVNKNDVTKQIRSREITAFSSKISVYEEIRDFCTNLQRELAKGKNIVIEGRDIGTTVFPKAKIKLYLDADPVERANRRFKELKQQNPSLEISIEEIIEDVKNRDQRDYDREFSPLVCPKDAIKVDTTGITLEEVLVKMEKIVKLRDKDQKVPKEKKERFLFSYKGRKVSLVYIITKWLFVAYFKLLHRYKVYGLEHLKKNTPAIIACNHISFYDPPMVAAACPEVVHGLARKTLFKNAIISYWFKKINTYPLTGTASDRKVMKRVFDVLKQKEKIIIFPEGTRSKDGKLKKLKEGLALLADKGNAEVIPTAVIGPEEALPRNKKFPKFFTTLKVVFGEPISFSSILKEVGDKKKAREVFLQRVHDSIVQLIKSHKNH